MKSKKNKIKTSVKKIIKKLVKDGLEDLQWPSELGRYQWVEYIYDNDTNVMSIEVSTVTRDENGNLFNEQSFINIYKTCKKKKFKKYLYNDIMYEIFYNYNNTDDHRLYDSFIKHIDTEDKGEQYVSLVPSRFICENEKYVYKTAILHKEYNMVNKNCTRASIINMVYIKISINMQWLNNEIKKINEIKEENNE